MTEVSQWRTMLARIITDPRYLANLDWGEPRRGHPEATIRAHIAELEANLVPMIASGLSDVEIGQLRVLIHVHDTFKPDSHTRRPGSVAPPILHPDSHASIARAFLAECTDDLAMLATVQYHDEPFALWRQWSQRGRFNLDRWQALLAAIPNWDLFIAFLIIDGTTAGKSTAPREWFLDQIAGLVTTRWTAEIVRAVERFRTQPPSGQPMDEERPWEMRP